MMPGVLEGVKKSDVSFGREMEIVKEFPLTPTLSRQGRGSF